jgi:hypothetical protein
MSGSVQNYLVGEQEIDTRLSKMPAEAVCDLR